MFPPVFFQRYRLVPAFLAFGALAALPARAQVSMTTYHNDALRTGLNSNETLLAPSNVNSTDFGKLFSQSVDGQVYAQPLVVPNLSIAGGTHNVVLVCTEHDSVYAFDADSNQAALWHVSFLNAGTGVTTVAQADVGNCPQITTEIGITDTPAVDTASNTLYVVAMTKQVSGAVTNYYQTLHALDLSTGAEKAGGPSTIQAAAAGTGDGGTTDTFNPHAYKMRSGLFLYNGVVYTCATSHCDFNTWGTYHGWLIGYNASAVTQQVGVFNVTPNGSEGAIWSVGDAPSVDTAGNLYLETANGTFDANTGGTDYGDSILRITGSGTSGLAAADYFTPANQASLSSSDQDLGSVGQILLPDSFGTAAHPHLLTGGDKTGEVYLLDRDNLGGYQKGPGGTDAVVQEFHAATGTSNQCFSVPACFNGFVYWSMVGQTLKAYSLSNGLYTTTASSQTAETYANPGCVPSLSSNGDTNGILWAIQPGNPAVLRAYDATNLGTELYNSTQAAGNRDGTGSANNKFTPPSIVNGKVYVPTSNSLVVYGLLITATPFPTPASTMTPSPTPTFTFSTTPTATASPTPTVTSSPSPTPTGTPTASPTGTATFSPTATFTFSATPSATASPTPTVTSSPSPTSTGTPTASPTGTSSSSPTPTGTATSSPTGTATFSVTSTFSATSTASKTNSPTFTFTATLTPSSSFTATPVSTSSPTVTFSATPTASSTPTAALSATPTPSSSATSTETQSPSSTSTFSTTPTSTAGGQGGIVVFPNPAKGPGPVTVLIQLETPAPWIQIELFTTAFRKVEQVTLQDPAQGTVQAVVPLTDAWGSPLSNGIYYLLVRTPQGRFLAKLLVLR